MLPASRRIALRVCNDVHSVVKLRGPARESLVDLDVEMPGGLPSSHTPKPLASSQSEGVAKLMEGQAAPHVALSASGRGEGRRGRE